MSTNGGKPLFQHDFFNPITGKYVKELGALEEYLITDVCDQYDKVFKIKDKELCIRDDVDVNSEDFCISFLCAATGGNTEILRMLVNAGVNVNYTDEYGYTAYLYAHENGHEEIMKILIEAGADVNLKPNKEPESDSDEEDIEL